MDAAPPEESARRRQRRDRRCPTMEDSIIEKASLLSFLLYEFFIFVLRFKYTYLLTNLYWFVFNIEKNISPMIVGNPFCHCPFKRTPNVSQVTGVEKFNNFLLIF